MICSRLIHKLQLSLSLLDENIELPPCRGEREGKSQKREGEKNREKQKRTREVKLRYVLGTKLVSGQGTDGISKGTDLLLLLTQLDPKSTSSASAVS